MSEQANRILQAIRELSPDDQIELLGEMLEEFSPPVTGLSMDDPDFFLELERRANDGSPGIPWEEVEASLLRRDPTDN